MLNIQYNQEEEFQAIREDAKEEIAKNGIEKNIPIETISVMTGLSIEEIGRLQQEM